MECDSRMNINLNLTKYKYARLSFFRWRHELTLAQKIMLAFTFACITGLLAQLRFYLPNTPIPITGQTFAVLLGAVLLGRWSALSQTMYVSIGLAGIPWFTGMNGGYMYFLGPTGGYLLGFILASAFLGYYVDKHIRARSFLSLLGLMFFANFIIIYGCGLLHLYAWSSLVQGPGVDVWVIFFMGVLPFVIGDAVKLTAVAAVANAITPKQAFNGEVDIKKAQSWKLP